MIQEVYDLMQRAADLCRSHYREDANPSSADCLGIALAIYFDDHRQPILRTAEVALEEGNFHADAEMVRRIGSIKGEYT